MSLIYRVLYRIGFTPWDTGAVPAQLTALVVGDGALPPGRALDLGCGTGTQSVYLAHHGWQVTGVDAVEQALRRARARAAADGVRVDWMRADVARLADHGLTPGFALVFDRGCYHGLSDQQRAGYADAVTRLTTPPATLLMMAFARNRVAVGPAGADKDEIAAAFDRWTVQSAELEEGPGPSGPLGSVPRYWYRLVRSGS